MTGYEYALLLVLVPKMGTVFDVVSGFSAFLAMVAGIMTIVTMADESEAPKKVHEEARKKLKPLIWILVISMPLSILWPTKSDLVTIVGGGVAYEIVMSDEAKEIGELSLEYVKRKLKEEE